jgi:hydroxymethylpyrimidine/phosphomethylpyrimidine kinase
VIASFPKPPIVLSIAGSDSCGGAGIQADIKTISACGAYAMTAITAITAQDHDGVKAMWPVTPDQLAAQITAALNYAPDVIKIGMLGNAALANIVADILDSRPEIPVVLDTIIRSSSGAPLLDEEGANILRTRLLPRATIATPNRQEARDLFRHTEDIELQSWAVEHKVLLLITGGDSDLALVGEQRFCTDLFISNEIEHLTSPRIETENHHGTGCTLSAALASFIAHGFSVAEAVHYARHYVQQALLSGAAQLWPGHGPLNHFFAFGKNTTPEIAS